MPQATRLKGLLLLAQRRGLATATACSANKVSGAIDFPLLSKYAASPDSSVLRFRLPDQLTTLGVPAPSGVKAFLHEEDTGELLVKSYSPVSHEDEPRSFELLVKAYPPRRGGGLGAFLCRLQPGDNATMKIMPPRAIHGSTAIHNRWSELGLVAGGTGVAPFVQVIRSLLAHPTDKTRICLLSVNRFEHDILMRSELEELAARHPDRLRLTFTLTQPGEAWTGHVGRGSAALGAAALPEAAVEDRGKVMVLVCGTDGFVASWAGELLRIKADPARGTKKQKLQGPIGGWLAELGFLSEQVYKF